ncbi:hypothetical protein K438DRAFT_1756184 [Mycena galopus ATCC 62051]|nr:hypothetical protein K438DRAFT_1756184 [Mycena galopus ATCC 62051]
MSGLFVIVDDQDPNIELSGGWGPTAAENEFQFGGTMTAPGGSGSTASYSFEGTSISVFGLMRANSAKANTTFGFAIDGDVQIPVTIGTDSAEHFHRKFFESQPLSDGPHSLDITVIDTNSTDVLLDYLIYEASPNSTVEASARLLALNTSPYLAYSQGWSPTITGLRSGLVETAISLNNTVEGAADLGATVALNFTGLGIEVRGVLVQPFPSPVASYSFDGGPWLDVQMPASGVSYENAQSNFEFIGQTFAAVETHSLVITPLIPGAFFLDFITVQSPTAFFPPKANIALPPTLTSSIAPEPTVTTSGTTSASPPALQAGVIAAICIGVAVLLGLAVSAGFLLRRRSLRHRSKESSEVYSESDTQSQGTAPRWSHSDVASRGITPYSVRSTSSGAAMELHISTTRPNRGMHKALPPEPAPADDDLRGPLTAPPAYTDRPTGIV